MNELQEEYEKSCAKARENIETQLGLFNELDGTAKTSIDNLIGTLKGQVEYMEIYAQSILCTFKCPTGKTEPEMCREIARWLSGTGRLAYDREPDKYYTASVSGSPPMELPIAARENPLYYQGMAETLCIVLRLFCAAPNARLYCVVLRSLLFGAAACSVSARLVCVFCSPFLLLRCALFSLTTRSEKETTPQLIIQIS